MIKTFNWSIACTSSDMDHFGSVIELEETLANPDRPRPLRWTTVVCNLHQSGRIAAKVDTRKDAAADSTDHRRICQGLVQSLYCVSYGKTQ